MKIRIEKDRQPVAGKGPWKVYNYTEWGRVIFARRWNFEAALLTALIQADGIAYRAAVAQEKENLAADRRRLAQEATC